MIEILYPQACVWFNPLPEAFDRIVVASNHRRFVEKTYTTARYTPQEGRYPGNIYYDTHDNQ